MIQIQPYTPHCTDLFAALEGVGVEVGDAVVFEAERGELRQRPQRARVQLLQFIPGEPQDAQRAQRREGRRRHRLQLVALQVQRLRTDESR